MNKKLILILLLLLILALVAPLLAQVSIHYDLTWHILSGGGGPRASTHYQLDDVLGQWPDGRSTSANYQIDPGYWHRGRLIQTQNYLPAVFKPS